MAYTIEIFVLTSAAVFLSVVGSVLFVDVTGTLCTVVASALFACALFLMSPVACFCAAVISAAASSLITYSVCGNIINALAGLLYIAVGAFIYFGVKTKQPRTRITVGAACFLAVFHALLVVLYFFMKTGTFSIAMVSSMVEAGLTEGAELAAGQIPAFSAMPESDKAAYMLELVTNTKALAPALFVLYSALVAYLSTSFFRPAYNIFIPMANPGRKKIKNKYWRLNISLASAATAVIAIFVSFFVPSQKYPLPSVILTNLIYIVAPGFCIVGIYFVHDKIFKEKTGIFSVVLAAGALIAALVLPVSLIALIFVLIFSGLYATLIGDIKKLIEKAKKALLGDDDGDDDDDYID